MKTSTILFRLAVALFIFGGCAKMGSLAGGAKDIKPPRVLVSRPANYSTNFNSQKIVIEFDEYVVLKNVNQELIISPPLPEKPEVKIKNKSIIIDLKNELRDSTTYTLNFGKAIADNNEGNLLTNFEFVFSTGDFLDSLSVKGTIISAFNLLPSKEPITIGLYDQFEDSIPLKSIPVYVGKSDDKGNFQVNNVKSDTFKLFALKDLNYNLLFDLPNEEIAFIDSLIILTPEFLSSLPERIIKEDTTLTDSQDSDPGIIKKRSKNEVVQEEYKKENTITDSTVKKPVLPALFVDMFYFLEEGNRQYMTNNERLGPESIQVCFNLPLKEDPGMRLINTDDSTNWYLPEISSKRDTFTYWITDTTVIKRDTLRLEVAYPMKDSMGLIYTRLDTLKYINRKAAPSKGGKNKAPEKAPVKLIMSSIRNNGTLDLNKNIPISFNFPLQEIDTSKLHLFFKVDSSEVLQDYTIIQDSSGIRQFYMVSEWKEKGNYRIQTLPGAFTDIYNQTNDTTLTKFKVQEKSFYGTLILSLSNLDTPVLVQLMNAKDAILRTGFMEGDGETRFEYLPPAKYKIKFVYDTNGNKKWDTGNYLKHIQPEKILFYNGEINIRSNWDLELKQDMESK